LSVIIVPVNILHALILSLVEGVTEFLPISSTGHMVLISHILNIPQTEFVKSFEIMIQPGAILAVVILFWKRLLNTKIWPQIIVAFLPAAVIGLLFYKLIKGYLIGNSLVTIVALLLGGLALIAIEHWHKKLPDSEQISNIEKITLKNAFLIGVFQSISVVPGVSRAGATILGALVLKTNRKTAAEFSFILAVPTMFAASALDIVKTHLSFSGSELNILTLGFVASFIVALTTVKLFIKYLEKHDFIPFGVYRIAIAIIFFLLFLR